VNQRLVNRLPFNSVNDDVDEMLPVPMGDTGLYELMFPVGPGNNGFWLGWGAFNLN